MTNIVITGCSTGIGLETAKYLQDKFVTVYPTARYMKDVVMCYPYFRQVPRKITQPFDILAS